MKNDDKLEWLRKIADETTILRKSIVDDLGQQIVDLANLISGIIGSGGKLLIAGNGGSAADSSHFAGEMIVRLSSDNNRQALPAIALSADTSVLTAAANDYGFENVFSRQVEGLAKKGDMLFVISTSGNSQNLIKAVKTARDMGVITIGLLGASGGQLLSLVERAIIIPHPSTQRIQEEHIFIIHNLVALIESDLIK